MDAEQIKEDFENRKGNVLHLLERLGVSVDGDMFNHTEIRDPLLYLRQVKDEMMVNDINGMLLLQQLQQTCSGVGTVEIFSGRSKLTITLDGFDVFSLMPKAPPVIELISQVDEERAKKDLKLLKEKLNA
jgi:hypothetical protein